MWTVFLRNHSMEQVNTLLLSMLKGKCININPNRFGQINKYTESQYSLIFVFIKVFFFI